MHMRQASGWAIVILAACAVIFGVAGGFNGAPRTVTVTRLTTVPETLTGPAARADECPIGAAFMGCASGVQSAPQLDRAPTTNGATPGVSGCVFPDVSSYQGHPDWAAAAPYICAAVAKAGEGGVGEDPDFQWNVGRLRALHIPWAAYFFVRQCSDGPQFVRELRSVGFRGDRDALRPVLDLEVPSAAGCATPIAMTVHTAFGVWPVIYTAAGTWPGGSPDGLPVWEAGYSSALPPLPFRATVVAWQRYSPPYAYLTVPGLGDIDESVNLHGFATGFAFPKPTPGLGAPEHYSWWPDAYRPAAHSRERQVVERWDTHRCLNPARREICRATRHLLALNLRWDRMLACVESRREKIAARLPGQIAGLERRLATPGRVTAWIR
jgi:hypothetical protein